MTVTEFEHVATRLRPQLVSRSRALLCDDTAAEDVAQEVLLRLWNMADRLADVRSIDALAHVMARNMCIDELRRTQRVGVVPADMVAERALGVTESAESEYARREEAEGVLAMFASLPPGVRMVMQMRHVDGLEVDEIARLAGVSVESVRVNLSRGRKRMKEIFNVK